MSIIIQPELEARLRARADAEGITVEAYIERIARDDEQAEEELEALAREGQNSGEFVVADERFWNERRQVLIEKHLATQKDQKTQAR